LYSPKNNVERNDFSIGPSNEESFKVRVRERYDRDEGKTLEKKIRGETKKGQERDKEREKEREKSVSLEAYLDDRGESPQIVGDERYGLYRYERERKKGRERQLREEQKALDREQRHQEQQSARERDERIHEKDRMLLESQIQPQLYRSTFATDPTRSRRDSSSRHPVLSVEERAREKEAQNLKHQQRMQLREKLHPGNSKHQSSSSSEHKELPMIPEEEKLSERFVRQHEMRVNLRDEVVKMHQQLQQEKSDREPNERDQWRVANLSSNRPVPQNSESSSKNRRSGSNWSSFGPGAMTVNKRMLCFFVCLFLVLFMFSLLILR
jgi:hypothetical protein